MYCFNQESSNAVAFASTATERYVTPYDQKRESLMSTSRNHADKKWIGAGLAIGAGLGSAIGVLFDNIPMGLAAGVALGVLVGVALSRGRR